MRDDKYTHAYLYIGIQTTIFINSLPLVERVLDLVVVRDAVAIPCSWDREQIDDAIHVIMSFISATANFSPTKSSCFTAYCRQRALMRNRPPPPRGKQQ